MGRLTGKVAVVTGAASRSEGIGNGAATAILFAREGAKVVLVNRDRERAEALERQIRDENGEASAFAADVTQPEAAEAMAAFAVGALWPARCPSQQCRHRRTRDGGDGRPVQLEPTVRDQSEFRLVELQVLYSADARERWWFDH